jgi:hypothetical protein
MKPWSDKLRMSWLTTTEDSWPLTPERPKPRNMVVLVLEPRNKNLTDKSFCTARFHSIKQLFPGFLSVFFSLSAWSRLSCFWPVSVLHSPKWKPPNAFGVALPLDLLQYNYNIFIFAAPPQLTTSAFVFSIWKPLGWETKTLRAPEKFLNNLMEVRFFFC